MQRREVKHYHLDAIDTDRNSRPRVVPEVAGAHGSAAPRIMARVARNAVVAVALALGVSFAATLLLPAVAP